MSGFQQRAQSKVQTTNWRHQNEKRPEDIKNEDTNPYINIELSI